MSTSQTGSELSSDIRELIAEWQKLDAAALLGTESRKQCEDFKNELQQKLQKLKADLIPKIKVREAVGLDLLFLIDITGSMRPYRDGVVNEISRIVALLEASFKYSKDNIRVAVVGYRDVKLEPRFEILPFTPVGSSGVEAIKEWLKKLKFSTDKSNDRPEDVHGGLEQAASEELGWRNAARTIVHIADAPGHGTRLAAPDAWWCRKGRRGDDFPDYDADGTELARLLTRLRVEIKVQTYMFIHIIWQEGRQPDTRVMLQRFNEACGDPSWITEVEWQGDKELGLQVTAAATESINNSVSSRAGRLQVAPADREFRIDPAEPDWEKLQALPINVTRHNVEWLGSIEKLLSLIRSKKHIGTEKVTEADISRVRIAPNPFAKGKNRLAYYGRYYPKGVAGGECHEVVLKEFISCAGEDNSATAYKAQMEAQTVAAFLAEHFNRHAAEVAGELNVPLVKYAPCDLIAVHIGRRLVRFLLMEPLILGDMRKFNSNYGGVGFADPQPYLQSFSHWTYEVSDKLLMVVDLQGFLTFKRNDEPEVVLVDPAIHCSQEGFFANTNLASVGGFEAFLYSHMNPTLGNFGLHGPICEALLPSCADYRARQHRLFKPGQAPVALALWRGACGGDDDDDSASLSSVRTSVSINERVEAVKKATKTHAACKQRLTQAGLAVPANLNAAIELCRAKGLITPEQAAAYHKDRVAANEARHAW